MEKGKLRDEWGPDGKNLRVFTPLEGAREMTTAFADVCEAIVSAAREGAGCFPTKYA